MITNDRGLGNLNQQKIYVNGILVSTTLSTTYRYDCSRNYLTQFKLYIGDRASTKPSSVAPFIGSLSKYKLYPRILSPEEILTLYEN